MISDRQRTILFALVEEYTRSAVPVASKALTKGKRFAVSPATMRNEFAALEREGLIQKQHTSAGRIPTDAGYRMFVNQYLAKSAVVSQREPKVNRVFEESFAADHTFERELARVIAELSHEVAVVASGEADIHYSGVSNLFGQPEFDTGEHVQAIFHAMDHFEELMPRLLSTFKDSDRPTVLIGNETSLSSDCSIILMRHRFDDGVSEGLLAILGPTRMHYRSNINILQNAAKALTHYGTRKRQTKRNTA